MKVIDLLNKIANGEEVPKMIKYDTLNYMFRNYDYKEMHGELIDEQTSFMERIDFYKLNDEVEIIEEEKKTKPLTKKDIEALGYACGEIRKCFINGWTKSLETKPLEGQKKIPEKLDLILDEQFTNDELQAYIYETQEKVNQVIDYLKSKGDE